MRDWWTFFSRASFSLWRAASFRRNSVWTVASFMSPPFWETSDSIDWIFWYFSSNSRFVARSCWMSCMPSGFTVDLSCQFRIVCLLEEILWTVLIFFRSHCHCCFRWSFDNFVHLCADWIVGNQQQQLEDSLKDLELVLGQLTRQWVFQIFPLSCVEKGGKKKKKQRNQQRLKWFGSTKSQLWNIWS